jgi:hypothetical protein
VRRSWSRRRGEVGLDGVAETTGALLCRAALTKPRDEIDIVIQLDTSRTVQLDLFQGLSDDVVRLSLAVLGSLDRGRFIDVALVVDVELSEGI